jgi:ammonia channel protein AmtB
MGALAIDWPAGVLFLAGAYWIRRGGIGGPILVGLLAAIEAVAVPLRGPYADWAQDRWIVQAAAVAVCLVVAITATAVVVESIRRQRSVATGGPS